MPSMLPDFRLRQREYLLEISRAMSARLDLSSLLELTLESAVELLAGQAGLITLRQYGSSEFNTGTGNSTTSGSGDGADVWSVGGSFTIGNNVIGADYGQGDEADDPTVLNDDYKSWRVGAYHKFSDRTRVYVGYAGADRSDLDDVSLFSVGARHNF